MMVQQSKGIESRSLAQNIAHLFKSGAEMASAVESETEHITPLIDPVWGISEWEATATNKPVLSRGHSDRMELGQCERDAEELEPLGGRDVPESFEIYSEQ